MKKLSMSFASAILALPIFMANVSASNAAPAPTLNCPKAVTITVYYKTSMMSNVTYYKFYHNPSWDAKKGIVNKEVLIGNATSLTRGEAAKQLKDSITSKIAQLQLDITAGCNKDKKPKDATKVTIQDNASQLFS